MNPSPLQNLIASLVMGMLGLGAGVFLYTHGGQQVGSGLIIAVAGMWFLHAHTANTQAMTQQTVSSLLGMLGSSSPAASSSTTTTPDTSTTTTFRLPGG